MTKDKNDELIDWIKNGDLKQRDQAFITLYEQYYTVILAMIVKNKGTKEDAKDIFQDGLIVVYNQIQKGAFQEKSSIQTYLYAICRRLWLKKLTRGTTTYDLLDDKDYEEVKDDVLEGLIGNEREQCVENLLQSLGEECNKILKLFYYDKFSMRKIMGQLQLASEQVAKNKKMKCLKRMRKLVLENKSYVSLLKPNNDG